MGQEVSKADNSPVFQDVCTNQSTKTLKRGTNNIPEKLANLDINEDKPSASPVLKQSILGSSNAQTMVSSSHNIPEPIQTRCSCSTSTKSEPAMTRTSSVFNNKTFQPARNSTFGQTTSLTSQNYTPICGDNSPSITMSFASRPSSDPQYISETSRLSSEHPSQSPSYRR